MIIAIVYMWEFFFSFSKSESIAFWIIYFIGYVLEANEICEVVNLFEEDRMEFDDKLFNFLRLC